MLYVLQMVTSVMLIREISALSQQGQVLIVSEECRETGHNIMYFRSNFLN